MIRTSADGKPCARGLSGSPLLWKEGEGDGGGGDGDALENVAEVGVDFLGGGGEEVGRDFIEEGGEIVEGGEAFGTAGGGEGGVGELGFYFSETHIQAGDTGGVICKGQGASFIGFDEAVTAGGEIGGGFCQVGGLLGRSGELNVFEILQFEDELSGDAGEEVGIQDVDVSAVIFTDPAAAVWRHGAIVFGVDTRAADAAVEQVGEAVSALACVFASTAGELSINAELCGGIPERDVRACAFDNARGWVIDKGDVPSSRVGRAACDPEVEFAAVEAVGHNVAGDHIRPA